MGNNQVQKSNPFSYQPVIGYAGDDAICRNNDAASTTYTLCEPNLLDRLSQRQPAVGQQRLPDGSRVLYIPVSRRSDEVAGEVRTVTVIARTNVFVINKHGQPFEASVRRKNATPVFATKVTVLTVTDKLRAPENAYYKISGHIEYQENGKTQYDKKTWYLSEEGAFLDYADPTPTLSFSQL